jgi:hypothetical protein
MNSCKGYRIQLRGAASEQLSRRAMRSFDMPTELWGRRAHCPAELKSGRTGSGTKTAARELSIER